MGLLKARRAPSRMRIPTSERLRMSSMGIEVDLSAEKKRFLTADGHLLALGGPGSGKTYIALRKAEQVALGGSLRHGQRVLFLSFARATIARVDQQARAILRTAHDALEVSTYHGFAWRLLQSHGYLLVGGRRIVLLPPPEAKARLSSVAPAERGEEIKRLLNEEGLLHFDLFAPLAASLLERSERIRHMICSAYPLIILDEFQDTNADEWRMIQSLSERSCLVCLADAEQRIYDFRGADPRRIGDFVSACSPNQFDLANENRRSSGTDIVTYGNDLLTGVNRARGYNDVEIVESRFYKGRSPHFDLKTRVLQVRRRLMGVPAWPWSLAILVPSKQLMLEVSDYLISALDGLPKINHEVALDGAGPALAAALIAALLEAGDDSSIAARRLVSDLCVHIRGRRDEVSKENAGMVDALSAYAQAGARVRGKNRQLVVVEAEAIVAMRQGLRFSGDPAADWLEIRRLLEGSKAELFRTVAVDAKYLRLLHKGALLRARLGALWRKNQSYVGATVAVREALLQEHFSMALKDWRGVHVMTIHKAKGKEFDEVVLYEGMFQGRYLRRDSTLEELARSRLVLRVGVTRAMRRATIMTPIGDRCALL